MTFTFKLKDCIFTSNNNQCITTFSDNTKIIINIDVNGNFIFPSKYIDKNGNSVLIKNWRDVFNCYSRPLIGGSGYNDF